MKYYKHGLVMSRNTLNSNEVFELIKHAMTFCDKVTVVTSSSDVMSEVTELVMSRYNTLGRLNFSPLVPDKLESGTAIITDTPGFGLGIDEFKYTIRG